MGIGAGNNSILRSASSVSISNKLFNFKRDGYYFSL